MNKTILLLLFVSAGMLNIFAQGIAEVSIPFQVYDNAGGEKVLYFGLDPTATDTIDFHLGESNLPPVPPAGAFDARWILPKNNFNGSLSSWNDYRNVPGFPFTDTLEHRLWYQAKTGADTMFFSWNFPEEVTGLLQDLITGTIVNQPVSDNGIFAFTNFVVLNQLKLTIYYDAILPVELSSFTASVSGSNVILNWTTASEVNNQGFEVERSALSAERKAWETIGYVEGNETTAEAKSYSFVDNTVTTGIYSYRLKQIDFNGSYEYSKVVEVDVELTPREFMLHQNYPNPFNPSTKINFSLPEAGQVTLKVYNLLGEEIATLINEYKNAGNYEAELSLSELNNNLSSGIYFYQLRFKQFTSTKKMMVIK